MNRKPQKIVFCISPHGFGHAAQTCSVINQLFKQTTEIDVFVKTSLPQAFIQERIINPINYIPNIIDFGMIMSSSIDVLAKESWQRYQQLHTQWEANVQQEINSLASIKPDLVVSNVAYVVLEAACRLSIPSVAMCSLNWADIFDYYCHDFEDAKAITAQMQNSYNSAQTFIQFTPCPPMTWLNNRQAVSPITRYGKNQRMHINKHLSLNSDTQLVLIGLGGIEMRLPIESWPQRKNTLWVVPDEWQTRRDDCLPLSRLNLPFIDILASVDALITKPGYGTFTEAVCHQLPFLYVPRGGWPEEPYLETWAKQYGVAASVHRVALNNGEFYTHLDQVLFEKRGSNITPLNATGADEAVNIILSFLK